MQCGEGANTAYQSLLADLKGITGTDPKEKDSRGIRSELQKELQGQRCLIWLDNVQEKELMSVFRIDGFQGALLVTANEKNIWDGLPDPQKVELGLDTFWRDADSVGGSIASRLLASRAANDKNTTTFPPGCEVRFFWEEIGQFARHCVLRIVPRLRLLGFVRQPRFLRMTVIGPSTRGTV